MRITTRAARVAAILLGIAIPLGSALVGAPAANAVPLASLTLKAAPGTPLDAHRCAVVTKGRDFNVAGRLMADAAGIGVLGQTIEFLVDGHHAAVATTDLSGKYAAALALDPLSAHKIVARLSLMTDRTRLEPTVSAATSAAGIQSRQLATCAQTEIPVDPSKPDCARTNSCTPVTTPPTKGNGKTVRPVVPPVVPTTIVPPPVEPPPCTVTRSCPPPPPMASCGAGHFLCSVPGIPAVLHMPKHVPVLLLLAVIFGMAFPAGLFNSTLEANRDQVFGWFRRLLPAATRRPSLRPTRRSRLSKLAAFVVAAGAACALAETPDPNAHHGSTQTLAAFLGFSAAILLVIAAFELPKILHARRHHSEYSGAIRSLPAGLITAFACAAGSRALGLNQTYVYGVVAAFAVTRGTRNDRQANVAAAHVALSVGLMTVGAWVLWTVVGPWAKHNDTSFLPLFAGRVCASAFLAGFEGLLINFLPLRFLDGPRLKAWSRHAWVAVEGAALVLLVLVVSYDDPAQIDRHLAKPHHISQAPLVAFFAFALGSFAFWGYFRLWGTTERRTQPFLGYSWPANA
jgi:hypothetical protein